MGKKKGKKKKGWRSRTIEIVAINVGRRISVSSEDEIFPIEGLLDGDGDPCDDEDDARFAVAGSDEQGWVLLEIADFSEGYGCH